MDITNETSTLEVISITLTKIEILIKDVSNRNRLPATIYLNQKEGAELIRVKIDQLRYCTKKCFIKTYPRQGKGFVYKVKDLIELADQIDNGIITIN